MWNPVGELSKKANCCRLPSVRRRPSVIDCGGGMSASCTAGPIIVYWRWQRMTMPISCHLERRKAMLLLSLDSCKQLVSRPLTNNHWKWSTTTCQLNLDKFAKRFGVITAAATPKKVVLSTALVFFLLPTLIVKRRSEITFAVSFRSCCF